MLRWLPTLISAAAITTACSLIAPSDSELLKPPSSGGTGGTAGREGTGGDGGSNAAGTGGALADASQGAGGSGAGGAGDDGGGNRGGTSSGGSAGTTGEGGIDASAGTSGTNGASGSPGSGGTGGNDALPRDGMVLWLTAMQGVVQTQNAVSKWTDQSPLGNHATQNALLAQPTLGYEWGLPTVDFDGTDQFLVLPPSAGFADFSRGLTAFFAMQSHGGGPCQALVQFSNGPSNDEILIQRETEGDFVYKAPGGIARCGRNTIRIDDPMLVAVVHSGSEASLYADAVPCSVATVGPLNNVVRNSATIGRAALASCARYSGHIAEMVVYNRALNPQERIAVELHLQNRWGI
jgi:hypothetical protein